MNENPPSLPEEPRQPPPLTIYQKSSPSFGLMFGLGVGLFVVSILICFLFQNPQPIFAGAIGAFISVFFKGYRGICAGYAATVGLVLLGTIIYCANHPVNF